MEQLPEVLRMEPDGVRRVCTEIFCSVTACGNISAFEDSHQYIMEE